jgi:hypothetical protein
VPDINVGNGKEVKTHSRIMSWNKLQEVLPTVGYTIDKARKRLNGKPNP